MKYVPSALIGRLSRSAGSTTASHNKFGAYLRNRVMPTNPQSSFQTAVRGNFSDLSTAFRTLTDPQKEGWITLGQSMERTDSLGQTYSMTGIQAFISVNNNLLTVGEAAVDDAPAYQLPDQPASGVATIGAGLSSFSIAFTPPASGDFILVYATRPMSAGRMFAARSEYKLIAILDDASTSPEAAATAYISRFGSFASKAGEKVFLRLIAISAEGFASTPIQSSSIIGA